MQEVELVPEFHPSEEEFSDPLKYIKSVKEQGQKYGMLFDLCKYLLVLLLL